MSSKPFALGLLLVPVLLWATVDIACPPEGSGGDVIVNRLKNRATVPASYEPLTVEQFLQALPPDLHTPRSRAQVSRAHRAYLESHEAVGVTLEGYVLDAEHMWPEEANCYALTRRDFHVWLGATRPPSLREGKAMRAQAVIVEPTPAGQQAHATWRRDLLERLATDAARVRVSGWLMYDADHPEEVGKTRGTLWEVHPVTRIEVWSGGQWLELN